MQYSFSLTVVLATGYDTKFGFLDSDLIDGSQNEIK